MRSHDESLIWKTLLEQDKDVALPGMSLPDPREQKINIFTNRFIEGLREFYPDRDAMIPAVKDALMNTDMVDFNEETDLHLVIKIVDRKMR